MSYGSFTQTFDIEYEFTKEGDWYSIFKGGEFQAKVLGHSSVIEFIKTDMVEAAAYEAAILEEDVLSWMED